MALGISAVVDDDTHSPNVTLTVTGLTVGVDFTVTRIDNTGEYATTTVRGLDTIEATSSSDAGVDFEAPVGRSIKYRVTQDAATADSSSVSLAYDTIGDCWIKSISNPTLSRKVVMSEWPDTNYQPAILSNIKILGRIKPFLITDAWGSRSGSFVVVTDNDDGLLSTTWQQLVALFTGGGTLFLQTVGQTPTGQSDMYFEIEGYSRTRMGVLRQDGKNVYKHSIDYIEVDRPSTLEESLSLRSYADVLEQASQSKLSDTFTRSVSNDWGSAESGQPWSIVDGTAANFDVGGATGTIALTAANDLHIAVADIGSTDFDINVQVQLNVASATTASIGQWVIGRYSDISNYYFARLDVTTGGAIQLGIYEVVAGSEAAIASLTTVKTGHSSNEVWNVRFKGDGTSLKAYAWETGDSEPTSWQREVTDASLTSGTKIGLGGRRQTSNANSCTLTWNNLTVTDSASYQDIINNYTSYLTLLTTVYPPGG